MRYILYTLLSISLWFSTSHAAFSQGIDFFEGNWEEALELAGEEEKLIFVDCYAVWCGPCKRMAANVFPNEEVGAFFNENFINLKWDMEKGKGLDFRKKFPVSAFPTLYFIDSSGEVVLSVTGGRDVNGLIELGRQAMRNYNPHSGYSEKFREGDRSTQTIYYHLKNLNREGTDVLALANEHLGRDADFTDEYELKMLTLAMSESDSRLFNQFIAHKDRIVEAHGEEFYYDKIRNAGWNTLRKAMNFREPFLVDEAIQNMERAGLPDLHVFGLKSHLYFAVRTRDEQRFNENLAPFLKQYGAEDVEASIEFTDLGLRVFGETSELLDNLHSGLSEASDKSKHPELYYRHAKVLKKLGRTRQARRAIDHAIEAAAEDRLEKYELLKSQIQ